jgi:hypothetical protein
VSPTKSPTKSPTVSPTVPTKAPTKSPTVSPTLHGADFIVNSGTTAYVSVSAFDSTKALACYRDTGNSNQATCNHLTKVGTYMSKGSDLVVNAATSSYVVCDTLDSDEAVVCYKDEANSNQATCNHLAVSTTTLSKGADLIVNTATSSYVAVSSFDDNEAVVCYKDEGNSNQGTCNHLAVSGTSLSKGADLIINAAGTSELTVANFDGDEAAVCYQDEGNSNYGTCNHLAASGTSLSKGADLVFNGDGATTYISVEAFDATSGMVCYKDGGNSNYGTCNHLAVSSTSLSTGSPLVVNTDGTTEWISATTFSATTGAVCYKDFGNSNHGTCNHITKSSTTLSKGADFVFSTASTENIGIVSFDADEAVVCYDDGGNSNYGTCNVVTVSGTSLV